VANEDLKTLALQSIDDEISKLEEKKTILLSAKSQIENLTSEQISAVVSVESFYHKMFISQKRINVPQNFQDQIRTKNRQTT
jgi:hypothetical protein